MSTHRFNFKAVILGAVVDVGLSLVAGVIMGLVAGVALVLRGMPVDQLESWLDESVGMRLSGLLLGTACTLVGGYVAGRIAGHRQALHGLAAGVLGLVATYWLLVQEPIWYQVAGIIVTPAAAALGGHVAKK